MSDVLNPAPTGTVDNGLDATLAKYLEKEGGGPGSTPSGAPLNVRFGNETISVKSPEELQGELDKRMQVFAQAYQNERSQWEARLAAQSTPPPPPPSVTTPTAPVGEDDPVAFVQRLVSDPRGTLETALSSRFAELDELKGQLERQRFTMAHPLYGDTRIMTGLEAVCKQNGMPVTAQNLEIASSWAVSKQLIPDENAFREQQRQQLLQTLQGQGGQPGQPGGYNFNGAPPPPPSTSNIQNGGAPPSQLDMAVRLAPQMSKEDLERTIQALGGRV